LIWWIKKKTHGKLGDRIEKPVYTAIAHTKQPQASSWKDMSVPVIETSHGTKKGAMRDGCVPVRDNGKQT